MVEEVLTKEKSHPLGIKVRCVGNFGGRVVRILAKGDDAETIATELGAELRKPRRMKGIRGQIMAAQSISKYATPYTTTADEWQPRGPAEDALTALEAIEAMEALEGGGAKQEKGKKFKKKSGKAKMREANERASEQ